MPEPDAGFAERLKGLRDEKGLTQQQLAVAAELSISTVTQLEAGKIPDPRLSTVVALARTLGVSLDRLGAEKRQRGRPRKAK